MPWMFPAPMRWITQSRSSVALTVGFRRVRRKVMPDSQARLRMSLLFAAPSESMKFMSTQSRVIAFRSSREWMIAQRRSSNASEVAK